MNLKKMFLFAFGIAILIIILAILIPILILMIFRSKPVQKYINRDRIREIYVRFKKDVTYVEIIEIPLVKKFQTTSHFSNPSVTVIAPSEKVENIIQNLKNNKKVIEAYFSPKYSEINVKFLPEVSESEAHQIMSKESLSFSYFCDYIEVTIYPIREIEVDGYVDELKKNPLVDMAYTLPLIIY